MIHQAIHHIMIVSLPLINFHLFSIASIDGGVDFWTTIALVPILFSVFYCPNTVFKNENLNCTKKMQACKNMAMALKYVVPFQ